ncbi:MAG: hypothetical protein R3319_02040 [Candidatus Bathyarchaeia archaeon]|nr:hypothetical protein [Candidatus Bathyarchaeia archaeon]
MPQYKIKGHGKDSGRSRTRTYKAKDEASVRALAESDGTGIKSLEELPPELPTERQVAYAKDLGIKIPPEITKNELSDLISCKVEDDTPASKTLINIAKEYGIEATNYAGEASLYSQIFSNLSQPGHERDLVAWFAFNVLNDRAEARRTKPISSPTDPQLSSLAEDLAADTKVVQSIRRYSGESLRWFGERTLSDGFTHSGGSNRTAAFKAVVAAGINNAFESKLVSSTSKVKTSGRPHRRSKKTVKRNAQGSVAGLIAIFLIVVIAIWALS